MHNMLAQYRVLLYTLSFERPYWIYRKCLANLATKIMIVVCSCSLYSSKCYKQVHKGMTIIEAYSHNQVIDFQLSMVTLYNE